MFTIYPAFLQWKLSKKQDKIRRCFQIMLLVCNNLLHTMKVNVDVREDYNPLWLLSSTKEISLHTRYVRRGACDKKKAYMKTAISQQERVVQFCTRQPRNTLNH